jgi:hypothetical protein
MDQFYASGTGNWDRRKYLGKHRRISLFATGILRRHSKFLIAAYAMILMTYHYVPHAAVDFEVHE